MRKQISSVTNYLFFIHLYREERAPLFEIDYVNRQSHDKSKRHNMLKAFYNPPSQEMQDKIHQFITQIYKEEKDTLTKLIGNINDCQLTKEQIDYITNQKACHTIPTEVERKLIEKGYTLKPVIKLTMEMSLAFAAMHYTPGMYGVLAANTILNDTFPKLFGPYASFGKTAFNFSLQVFAKDYTPSVLANKIARNYGPWVGPASILAYNIGPVAVPGIAENTRSGLNWLWNKATRKAPQTTSTVADTNTPKNIPKMGFF